MHHQICVCLIQFSFSTLVSNSHHFFFSHLSSLVIEPFHKFNFWLTLLTYSAHQAQQSGRSNLFTFFSPTGFVMPHVSSPPFSILFVFSSSFICRLPDLLPLVNIHLCCAVLRFSQIQFSIFFLMVAGNRNNLNICATLTKTTRPRVVPNCIVCHHPNRFIDSLARSVARPNLKTYLHETCCSSAARCVCMRVLVRVCGMCWQTLP